MASIKSVIFDLDGTLLDTIEDLGDSVNEVLLARSYPTHSYEKYCLFIGDGMENLISGASDVHRCFSGWSHNDINH